MEQNNNKFIRLQPKLHKNIMIPLPNVLNRSEIVELSRVTPTL